MSESVPPFPPYAFMGWQRKFYILLYKYFTYSIQMLHQFHHIEPITMWWVNSQYYKIISRREGSVYTCKFFMLLQTEHFHWSHLWVVNSVKRILYLYHLWPGREGKIPLHPLSSRLFILFKTLYLQSCFINQEGTNFGTQIPYSEGYRSLFRNFLLWSTWPLLFSTCV
jgi:hypothetical protein